MREQIISRIMELNTYVYGFSKQFGQLRKKLNLTKKELSRFLKLNLSSVYDIENGNGGINIKYIAYLYTKLNFNRNKLIEDICKNNIKLRFLSSNLFFNLKTYLKKHQPQSIKRKPFELKIWDTDFSVIISEKMINKIKTKINLLGGPFSVYNLTNVTPTIYYRLMNGKGIRIKNYHTIINFLRFNLKEAEKEIINLTYCGCNAIYPFIKKFNPLLFRIICHIIGDGSLPVKNVARWIQHKSNSDWLKNLIKKEIGFFPKVSQCTSRSCNSITISAYFAKLAKYIMDIDINLIKEPKSIKKFLKLPKEYKLQFLASFIVDEGYIRYGKARSCIISQSNEEILKSISLILESLNYQHSSIKKEIGKRRFVIYRLNIYSQGVLQFYKDINQLIKKYGIYAGLWHKQKELERYIKTLNPDIKYTKLEKDRINNVINDLAEQQGYISYAEIKKHPILKEKLKQRGDRYLIDKFYELTKREKFIRLSKGVYKLSR